MKRYVRCFDEIEQTAKSTFQSPNPGPGCTFISSDGEFVNIYPKLDVHEDLCEWVEEQLDIKLDYRDEEYFVREYGWIRLRSDPSLAIIELPSVRPSNSQWYALEDWISFVEDRGVDRIYLEVCDREASTLYELGKDGFSEDLVKLLKQFYSSGRLYANSRKGIKMKRWIHANNDIGVYRGVHYGIEDDHDQRYYFRNNKGRFEYADTEEELFAKIDHMLGKSDVNASTKTMYNKFRKWYNKLTDNQRVHVYKTADLSGIPAPDYDKATDDMLEWLMDECELTFDPEYEEDDVPEELASRPYVFYLSGVNSTWSDDILRIVEDMNGIKVYYSAANDDGILYSNRSTKYAVDSKETANAIFKKVKESKIPVNDKNIYPQRTDWSNAWNIVIDSYDGESHKISWHRIKGSRVPQEK